ncbi:MAG: ribokinase [Planctomycetota bacterium]|nr:ribokinase [Planctomycetota bacterium]
MGKRGAGRVIVVGSSNTDLVVHCATLPGGGETVLGGDLATFAGGKGANQAVAAARAGANVRFIGAFGDDAFGQARRADLEREGIDCSGCVTKKGVPSGVALIAIGKGAKGQKAENLIVVAPGANARLTPADVRRGMPKDLTLADVILVSLEIPYASVLEAMKLGWQDIGRARVILNPAPAPAKGLPKAFFAHCHWVTPNETEFEGLAGTKAGGNNAKRKADALSRKSNKFAPFPVFVVTRGARGAETYCSDLPEILYAKAPKVRPVDTVGAGDCFNGCYAAELSIKEVSALDFAVAAASLKVTRHGAQAGMPYRREILKTMKKA